MSPTNAGALAKNSSNHISSSISISSVSSPIDSQTASRPQYTQRSVTCYPTSVADYVSNNGSTVDSSSEFSYQMTEMKYSPNQQQQQQQQQQQINNGRVPSYPPLVYNEQFGTENMWPYQPATPLQQHEGWHQPHDYPPSVTPPTSLPRDPLAPPTST